MQTGGYQTVTKQWMTSQQLRSLFIQSMVCMCVCGCVLAAGDSHGVGRDKQVCVVKQGHLRPLHQHEESELDEQHQSQLPYAADVEEHGAGQQGQQYTVAEILQQRGDSEGGGGGGRGRLGEYSNLSCTQKNTYCTYTHTHRQYTHAKMLGD